MLEKIKNIFKSNNEEYRNEWEKPCWDLFKISSTWDGSIHTMQRVNSCEWHCLNCKGIITYNHAMSTCPDDWAIKSSRKNAGFCVDSCTEEMAAIDFHLIDFGNIEFISSGKLLC